MKKLFTLAIILLTLNSCSISNDDDEFKCSEKCGKIIKIEYVDNQPIVTFINTCGKEVIDYTPNPQYSLYIGDSYCDE